jgi:hypothetical protein
VCIEDYCRIPCRDNGDCPNYWSCNYDTGSCSDGLFLQRQKDAADRYALASNGLVKAIRGMTGNKTDVDPAEYVVSQPQIFSHAPNKPLDQLKDSFKDFNIPFTQEQMIVGGLGVMVIVFLCLAMAKCCCSSK